jgi:hypothetical protein
MLSTKQFLVTVDPDAPGDAMTVTRSEIVRHPAPALDVQLDLPRPLVERYVHRRHSRGVGNAGFIQTVVKLKRLNAFSYIAVVHCRIGGRRRNRLGQVAAYGQPLSQGDDGRV